MEIVVLWVICAIVCAVMAGNRHRSRGSWFVLGLFFGLIAVAVLAIIGPREPAVTAN
jgi:hypothetical protein